MPDLSIDRLTLQVPGLSEGAARRLALAVVDGLATAGFSGGSVDHLRVDLTAAAGMPPERLASQIVAEILRQC